MATMETTKTGEAILALIKELQDTQRFKDLNWEGTFEDYLEIVHRTPKVARTAFQRIYDMILSHGTEKITDGKEEIIRYRFFIDPEIAGEDAVFGLDRQLMYLVHMFKSAARRYGIEKRVMLLHGPVGSSKSTIVRRLKKGLEEYSHTEEGAAYTFGWRKEEKDGTGMYANCPMHEEPLHLIPQSMRAQALARLNEERRGEEKLEVEGDLCPFCRFMYNDLTRRYEGDWTRVVEHIRVHRLILSEKDRIGIGTFQPKDEKNQDSTELTGDINYRKIAEYGADSDPRAFNFDGEFNIANRGLVEFIEVLKLDVAFLYDLLGASQEHSIKPKKFSQIDIDEVIIGHSVAGPTPILYRYEGTPGWTTLAQLYERFTHDASGLEILAHDFDDDRVCWTPVRSLFRHRFTGNLLTTAQKWGAVETTPNHSIYGRDGQPFYPEDRHEIMAVRHLDGLFAPAEDMSEIAVVAGIDGFVQDDVHRVAGGGRMTRPCQPGWARLDLPRHVTAIQALVRHTFDELMRTDGSRRLSAQLDRTASLEYRAHFFEFKTLSPMLAAQVGTLATLLGYDYSVYCQERPDRSPVYRIRFVSGTGKRGGRHDRFEAHLHTRSVENEWVYDIECVGLHNFICGVGNVVCHNTNEPEYRKLQNDEFMEALRDRTAKVDIPYVTRLSDEIKIYEKDYNLDKVKGKHIAPHTIEMAAMWTVLTRLEEPKEARLTILQKLKLYNGKTLPGFTEDNIKELRAEAPREGMDGISPRYIQDKISNALVSDFGEGCVNPFMVLNELEHGLDHHSLITSEEQKRRYRELLTVVKEEYEDIVKNEVQRAIAADEEALTRLCANYIDNVKAYTQKERVRNKYTGQQEEPDERLMRSIEEKIDIPESRKDDFRGQIMNYIGALALNGKTFDYKSNERLQKALELKLFEDQKDSIKLTSLISSVVDKDTQEKIDVVKARLVNDYGYCDVCATDVLHYVASIFARGDVRR